MGVDPREAKIAERLAGEEEKRATGRTLEKMADEWSLASDWADGTRYGNEGLMKRHWLPTLGQRDPNSIIRQELRSILDDILEDTPSEARHAFVAIRTLYNWLNKEKQERHGVTRNPVAGMDAPPAGEPSTRVYSNDELKRIVAAVKGTIIEDYVMLILHTGTRATETRTARRADIDQARAMWAIPAERSKNRLPTTVMLSTGALEVLRRRPRFGEWVFPGLEKTWQRPQAELMAAWVAAGLKSEDGEQEGLRLHNLRRTVGDRIKGEFGPATQHGVLGHQEKELTATYGPTPRIKALAEAVQWWSDQLAAVLGTTPATSEAQTQARA